MSKLKDQLNKKYKRKAEFSEKADAWLDENVNQPLAKRGFENLGAGLSAGGSVMASLLDSEDNETAMTAPGVGKLAKEAVKLGKKLVGKGVKMTQEEILDLARKKSKAHKGVPKFSKLEQPTKEDPGFNYSEIQKAAKAKANAGDAAIEAKHANIEKKRKAQEEAAKFGYSGKVKAKRKNNAQDHLADIEFEDL